METPTYEEYRDVRVKGQYANFEVANVFGTTDAIFTKLGYVRRFEKEEGVPAVTRKCRVDKKREHRNYVAQRTGALRMGLDADYGKASNAPATDPRWREIRRLNDSLK